MIGSNSELFINKITNSSLKSKISEYLVDRLGNLIAMDFDLRQPNMAKPEAHIENCIRRMELYFLNTPDISVLEDFENIMTLFTVAIQDEDEGDEIVFNPELGQTKSNQINAKDTKHNKSTNANHVSKVVSSKASNIKSR